MKTKLINLAIVSTLLAATVGCRCPKPSTASQYELKSSYPTPTTVKQAYDDLDLNRALQCYRAFYPTVSAVYFRIYGPDAPAFDGSWKPGDFEEVK